MQAAPTTEPAMFFFTTNQLGFSPEFLGRIQLFAGVAELLGTLLLGGLMPLTWVFTPSHMKHYTRL